MSAPTNPLHRAVDAAPPASRGLTRAAHEGPPARTTTGSCTRAESYAEGRAEPSSTDAYALRQTLVVVLQPEFRAAFQAPPSDWFAAAERLAATEHVSAFAIATIFDEELLAAMGLARSDPWFAFAWRRLSSAVAQGHRLLAPAAASLHKKIWSPDSAASMVVAVADESETALVHPAPPQMPPEAVPASLEPPDETTAPPERMLRLLPEVTRTITAGATSVEALATAVFTHLTGRAA